MTRSIKACPVCLACSIHRRRGPVRYKCGACGALFSVPALKESRLDIDKMRLPAGLLKNIQKN